MERRSALSCFQSLYTAACRHDQAPGTGIQKRALHLAYLDHSQVPTLPFHAAGKVSLLFVVHKQCFGSEKLAMFNQTGNTKECTYIKLISPIKTTCLTYTRKATGVQHKAKRYIINFSSSSK